MSIEESTVEKEGTIEPKSLTEVFSSKTLRDEDFLNSLIGTEREETSNNVSEFADDLGNSSVWQKCSHLSQDENGNFEEHFESCQCGTIMVSDGGEKVCPQCGLYGGRTSHEFKDHIGHTKRNAAAVERITVGVEGGKTPLQALSQKARPKYKTSRRVKMVGGFEMAWYDDLLDSEEGFLDPLS